MYNFTHLSLYARGKSPRYPLDRRLGELQNRFERFGIEKSFFPLSRIELRPSSP
jgi:hypothetical protein